MPETDNEDWRVQMDNDVRGLGERMAGVETKMLNLRGFR
jgi:hypothetical protein